MSLRSSKTLRVLAVAGALCSSPLLAEDGADAAKGRVIFEQLCGICHAISADGGGPTMGPNLYGLVGRKAASEPNFPMYSSYLKAYDATWNFESLDEFLADPEKKVPGTTMAVKLAQKSDRADVIAFLASVE